MLLLLAVALTSCSEEKSPGEFDGWQGKNDAYLNDIVAQAEANADGKWETLLAYNLGDPQLYEGQKQYYVYVHKKEAGEEDGKTPLFTDSVRVHYEGRLIPSKSHLEGLVFDKSYAGDVLNEATDVPRLMKVGATVTGFATALQHMREGDRWDVYIPYYLGYKGTATGKIPAYSTLRFDLKLARIYRPGSDTSWR